MTVRYNPVIGILAIVVGGMGLALRAVTGRR
jgi:hypothetical protein